MANVPDIGSPLDSKHKLKAYSVITYTKNVIEKNKAMKVYESREV